MKYYYNNYIDMYCIKGTTYSCESIEGIEEYFTNEKLTKIPMPDYITADYDGTEW